MKKKPMKPIDADMSLLTFSSSSKGTRGGLGANHSNHWLRPFSMRICWLLQEVADNTGLAG